MLWLVAAIFIMAFGVALFFSEVRRQRTAARWRHDYEREQLARIRMGESPTRVVRHLRSMDAKRGTAPINKSVVDLDTLDDELTKLFPDGGAA